MSSYYSIDVALDDETGKEAEVVFFVGKVRRNVTEHGHAGRDNRNEDIAIFYFDQFFKERGQSLM